MLTVSLLLVALAAEAPAPPPTLPIATTSLAVLDFDNNSGNSTYDALGKGLSAMLISDLSAVPSLRLVERGRLVDLMEELNFQRTDYVDPATAQRMGRMVGAEYVVLGSISALDPQVRLDTRIVHVETGEIVKTADVQGRENRLFSLQQRLAEELMDGIELVFSPEDRELLRARQEANRIEEMQTMLAFSDGLRLFDREDYLGGAEKMAYVLRHAPESLVAQLVYREARDRAASNVRQRGTDAVRQLLRRRGGG